MNWVGKVVGFVIAIALIPTAVDAIADLTGVGMPLEGTAAGTLLDLAPLLLVAGIVTGFFYFSRKK